MLSDVDLMVAIMNHRLRVEPHSTGSVQPASIDLHLSEEFLVPQYSNDAVDLRSAGRDLVQIAKAPFELGPQDFALASTVEWVAVSAGLCGFVAGKSSLARHGLIVEAAGLVDPGFEGNLTLELFNMANRPLLLTPGIAVAQLYVLELKNPAHRPYGSHGLGSRYQGQQGPTAAREQT